MIIRESGIRHAGRALALAQAQAQAQAQPTRQAGIRALSTQLTTPTTRDPFSALTNGSLQAPGPGAKPGVPAIFSANAKGTRRKKAEEVDKTVELYHWGKELKAQIGSLGSHVEQRYRPGDVFANPPGPKDVTLELLMASQAHMGHHTSLWNPANTRYIYGIRQGIHIIALEETAAHLRRAARVVEEVAYRGGLVLFVGTRPGQTRVVTRAARLARGCHLFTKWTPGTITNRDVMLARMQMQMLDEHDEPLDGFNPHLNERLPLVPDLVVCLNPLENYTLLHECALANIPTIGVVDTNAEPSWVTYVIPANDDSLRCLAVIGSVLGRAGETGHKRRLEDAKLGIVEWRTPLDVQRYMAITRKLAREAAEKAARFVNPEKSTDDAESESADAESADAEPANAEPANAESANAESAMPPPDAMQDTRL